MPITNVEFAGVAAGLARDAASWAASTCVLPEKANKPVRPDTIARFTAEVRDRLEFLERWAAEAPTPALNREEADRHDR